jgi:hypothetical protein
MTLYADDAGRFDPALADLEGAVGVGGPVATLPLVIDRVVA